MFSLLPGQEGDISSFRPRGCALHPSADGYRAAPSINPSEGLVEFAHARHLLAGAYVSNCEHGFGRTSRGM